MAFTLTANLSLQRQVNIRPLISDIQKQLDRARFSISVNLDTRAIRQIEGILKRNGAAADSFNASLSSVNATAGKLGQTLSGQRFSTGSIKAINSELAISKRNIQSLDATSQKTFTGIAAQSYLAYRSISLLTNQFNEFKDYNALLVKFGQVSGLGLEKLRGLSDEVRKSSIAFGVNSKELLDVATNLSRAGLSADKVKASLSLFSKLSLSEGITDIKKATQAYIVLDRVFGQSSEQIESSFNKITNLSARFAIESEDIVTALSISGPIFKQLGGNLEDFASIFAATAEDSQLPASVVAQALKTIFTRVSAAPETINALKEVGISLQTLEGKFVGPTKATEILVNALGRLDDTDTRKLSILQQISGTRQISVLVSLLKSYGRQLEATAILKEHSNKLDRDAALAQSALATKLQSLSEVVKRDFATLFESKGVTDFTDNVIGLTKAFSSLLPVIAPLVPVIAALSLKSLVGRSGLGAGISSGLGGLTSSFNQGYSQPIAQRAIPTGRVLPTTLGSQSTLQKPIYARNPHFNPNLQGIGSVSDQYNKKSTTQQIGFVNKLSSQFADLSPTTKQLNGAFRHYLIQVNDGISSEKALSNTRAALMRVQQKQAAQLGIATNINTTYTGPANNKTAGFFGGAKNLLQSHGQGAAVLGLLANQANPHGVSRELINAGGGAGVAASFAGLGGPASAGVGLVAAFASYGSIIEDESKRLSSHRLSKAADDLAASLKLSGGKFTTSVLANGKELLEKLRDKQGATYEKHLSVPFLQSLSTYGARLIPNAIQGKYQDKNDINSEILAGRDTDFKDSIKQNLDGLEAFRQHILGSVKTLDEFKNFGGGLGDRLLQNLKKIDPAIEQATKQILEATNATTLQSAIAKNVANSISQASVEVDSKRRGLSPAYRLGTGRTEFDSQEIGTAGYHGQVGKLGLSSQVAGTLKDLNLVAKVAPKILAGGLDLGDKDRFSESIETQLKMAGVGHVVAESIASSLERNGFDAFKKSMENIEKASSDLVADYEPLINSVQRLTAANLEQVNIRNENFGKTASQYSSSIDSSVQARIQELNVQEQIQRYRTKGRGTLDTTSGNELVKSAAKALGGSSDPAKLGESLKKLNDEFEKTKDIRLKDSILHVESALKLLGDTATRTRGIEEALNKAKSQKDAKLGLVESFYGSDLKGRLSMIQGARLAGAAQRAGSLNGFSIPDQAKIIASLKAVADIKLGSGLTGKETLEALLKKSAPGIVAPEEAIIKDLELRSIEVGIDAAKASRELSNNQEALFRSFLTGMGDENRAFLSSLGTLLAPSRVPHHAAGGYVSGPGGPHTDSIPAMLSSGEYVINARAASAIGMDRLNQLNSVHLARGGSTRQAMLSQRRYQRANQQYQRTLAYVGRSRVLSAALAQGQIDWSTRAGSIVSAGKVFHYEGAYKNNSTLGRLGNVQQYERNNRAYERRGYKFADGGPVGSSLNMTGVSASIDRFHSSVLNLSHAISRLEGFNIPSHIQMEAKHEISVIHNGMAVFSTLEPRFVELIEIGISKAMKQHISLESRITGVT